MVDYSFKEDFKYKHENPYHERLGEFGDFVLRDHEAEAFKGLWNKDVFKRDGNLFLEIGTGAGHFMIDYCVDHPNDNFVGLDYRFKRSFYLAKKLAALDLKNFRYLRAKGERIEFMFAENELDGIFYKKRLIQEHFLKSAYRALKPGAIFYIKTDHDDYAAWMEREIKKCGLFDVLLESKDLRHEYPEHLLSKYTTGFERIFLEQGIKIKAFVLQSKKES
jgi:tRNA (guanine-N7-)-methyltransferase